MFFRTEHRTDLKYPFKDAYHHLLIKLRTLGKESILLKILQMKNIGTPFSAFGYDLGRMDFCKMLFLQKMADPVCQGFLNFENRSFPLIAKSDRPVIQQGFQGCVYSFLIDHHRAVPGGGGKELDMEELKVKASSGTRFFFDKDNCLYTAFLCKFF